MIPPSTYSRIRSSVRRRGILAASSRNDARFSPPLGWDRTMAGGTVLRDEGPDDRMEAHPGRRAVPARFARGGGRSFAGPHSTSDLAWHGMHAIRRNRYCDGASMPRCEGCDIRSEVADFNENRNWHRPQMPDVRDPDGDAGERYANRHGTKVRDPSNVAGTTQKLKVPRASSSSQSSMSGQSTAQVPKSDM